MRRLALVTLVLAACGARASTGPAWPKSAGTERVGDADQDGGESLEPRVPQAVVAVEQSADDDAPAAPAAAPTAKPADPAAGGAPAVTPTAGDPETPVMLDFEEEIVIDGGPQP
jgi:hypothetical protein